MKKKQQHSLLKLWGLPLLIAVMSIAGLVTALVGNGLLDVFSWIMLSIPVVLIIWYYYFSPNRF